MDETVTISGSAIIALVLESVPRILLPFLVFHFWRKRTNSPYTPALVGVGVFIVVIPV